MVDRSPRVLALACLLGLAACAHRGPAIQAASTTTPSAQASDAAASSTPVRAQGPWDGRLSLKLQAFGKDAARGVNMAFYLKGSPDQGELDLSTPLGTQMASVRWQHNQAVLVTADGTQRFASLDELTQHLLGESLPVTALMSWLQGRPDPLQPFSPAEGADHQAAVFNQAGWRVDLTQRQAGQLEASRQATSQQRGAALKVRLDL